MHCCYWIDVSTFRWSLSSGHHDLDLTLKSPIIIVKDGLKPLTKLRKFSKFGKNPSNSTVDWLRDG